MRGKELTIWSSKMQLNPSEISELIKTRIQGLEAGADLQNQGTVISVSDGIVRIHGLSNVEQGEMLEFPGSVFGLALNLERDSVGAVILGEYDSISEGDTVKCTGRLLQVPRSAHRSTAKARSMQSSSIRSKRSRLA
jgi:F-type H+-transporting ATPase subunit alpha